MSKSGSIAASALVAGLGSACETQNPLYILGNCEVYLFLQAPKYNLEKVEKSKTSKILDAIEMYVN
ncbi:MAG: hypothetical protein C4516_06870 [Oxalobacter sp.]|nr:MAG: hypothetical protein C4516_06870 [Oxalobacter sp.]